MHTQLQNSDAWVMLSVLYEHGYTGEAVSLAQIIGACDFIEHAIITYDELTGALVRLTSQQYITEAGALRFLPTSSILNQFNNYRQTNKRFNVQRDLQFITHTIHAGKWHPGFDYKKMNAGFRYPGLSFKDYQCAYHSYVNK